MTEDYLQQFKNEELNRRLLHRDNVPAIEEMLHEESQRLQHLQELERSGRLDFGPRIRRRDLKPILGEVKKEVDDFLGVGDVVPPRCSFYNSDIITSGRFLSPQISLTSVTSVLMNREPCYDFASKTIHPGRKRKYKKRSASIPLLAHEYAHHIQNVKGMVRRELNVFGEGHARGVQRHVSNVYAEREDNEAYLLDIVDKNCGELKGVYEWMCPKFGVTLRRSLLTTQTSGVDGIIFLLLYGEPSFHARGNAFFYMLERERGSQIYGEAVRGELLLN